MEWLSHFFHHFFCCYLPKVQTLMLSSAGILAGLGIWRHKIIAYFKGWVS